MQPSSNESPAMNLPAPVEQVAGGPVERPAAAAEQQASRPEQASAPERQAGPAAPQIIATPLPPVPSAGAATPANDVSAPAASAAATTDDGDLIEKEWVNKAKAIVERTRHDPYKQSEELTVVKADYLQRQYGKSIKLTK